MVGWRAGIAAAAMGAVLATGSLAKAADFDAEVQAALPLVRDAYAFLHSNPELGKKEQKAHDYIRQQLTALGYTQFVESPSASTAVVVVLDTGRPGPVVGLRAEMDARPLPNGRQEPASHNPRAAQPGVMHNCGHDAHAAMLLGTAAVLMRNRDRFVGKVVLIFQPAEETKGGADDLVNDGILTKLKIEKLFAQHAAPGMPVGTLGVSPGATLAGSNSISLTFTGFGSHAAAPFEGDDVLLSSARVVEDLSLAPARRLEIANRPVVVSITRFSADGGGLNQLPTTATAEGTLRAFEDPTKSLDGKPSLETILRARVEGLAKAYGLTVNWKLETGSPPTVNDPKLFEAVAPALAAAFPGQVETQPHRGMFSEDFAFYTPHVASLYLSWGIARGDLGEGGVHTVDFTIHPDAFAYGVTALTLLAEIGTTGRSDWRPLSKMP